ncbi:hypothetical protein D3C86_1399110 [compost metagenome]
MGQVAAGHGLQTLAQGGDGDVVFLGDTGLFGLCASAFFVSGLTRSGGFDFQTLVGDGGVLEGQQGVGHFADLVLATHGGDDDGLVAASQATHGRRHGRDRRSDHLGQPQTEQDRQNQGHGHADAQSDLGGGEGGALIFDGGGLAAGLSLDDRVEGGVDRLHHLRRNLAFRQSQGFGAGFRTAGQTHLGINDRGLIGADRLGQGHYALIGAGNMGRQRRHFLDARAEAGLVPLDPLQVIRLPGQDIGQNGALLLVHRPLQLAGLGRDRLGQGHRLLGRLQLANLHEDHHAQRDDHRHDQGEGPRQLAGNSYVVQVHRGRSCLLQCDARRRRPTRNQVFRD